MTANRRPKGTGTIRKRDGRFQAIIRYVDPNTGSRRQRAQTFDSRTDGQSWISTELSRIETEGPATGNRQTLADFLRLWLQCRDVTDLSPATQAWYRSAIERHIIPALGRHRLDRLTAAHIDAFLSTKRASGRLDGSSGLSRSSTRRLYVTLSKSLGYAHRMAVIGRNPMDRVDDPGAPQHDPTSKVWTMEQIGLFLNVTSTDRLHALWWLAAWTGMRRGELLGLEWSDVDLDAGLISIRRAWVQVDGIPMESTPKTSHGRRAVELDDRTVSVLRKHRTAQVQERLRAGSMWEDTDRLFVWEDGRPLRPDWTSRRFGQLLRTTDLPVITIHALRHSHATALLRAGVHPKVVQERLGHHSAAFTLDVYSHVSMNMQRDAVQRLSGANR